MRTTTATAVVLAGAALGLPAAADARPTGAQPRVLLRAPAGHGGSVAAHRRATRANHLRGRAVALARSLDHVHGRRVHVARVRRHARHAALPELRHRVHALHARLAAARTPAPAPAPAGSSASPALQAIAACESGGNPAADTGNGFYGKYQFTESTWRAVGGTGNPAAASEAEQDARAAALYAQQGSAPWPVCGR